MSMKRVTVICKRVTITVVFLRKYTVAFIQVFLLLSVLFYLLH